MIGIQGQDRAKGGALLRHPAPQHQPTDPCTTLTRLPGQRAGQSLLLDQPLKAAGELAQGRPEGRPFLVCRDRGFCPNATGALTPPLGPLAVARKASPRNDADEWDWPNPTVRL